MAAEDELDIALRTSRATGGATTGGIGMLGDSIELPQLPDVPRYALPNVSSVLPNYTNVEQDYIRRAFSKANYDSLGHLPDKLKANEVQKRRAELIEEMRTRKRDWISLQKATTWHGLFSEFDYVHEPYDEIDRLLREEKERRMAEMERFGHNFHAGGTTHKAKFEDLASEKFFTYSCDPYEAAQDLQLRAKWLEDCKMLYGPFVPTGKERSKTNAPTLTAESENLANIQKIIQADWPNTTVEVFVKKEKPEWVVRVKTADVDSTEGLTAYMNILLRCNDFIAKLQLGRVVERWAFTPSPPDGFTYYYLRPPWVRSGPVESFYALHPEASSFS